jgi:hypothetical protein
MAVAVAALVVALGGTASAAFGPFKGDTLIKKHSLSGNRLKNGTITGAQINLRRLGTVPNATTAVTATHATTADTATHATTANTATHATMADTATHATTADTATNATELGGASASTYVTSADAIPAGDLSGTYGSPTIAPGAITGAKVAANSLTGANIDESTLSGIGAGVMTGRLNTLSASVINGGPPVGTSTGTSASIVTYQTVSPSVDLVARDFTFRLSAPPGSGASRDMEFVVGGGATVMCTISGSATSCTAPGPVSLPASTPFSLQTEPHGSPAAADLSFGYVLTTP